MTATWNEDIITAAELRTVLDGGTTKLTLLDLRHTPGAPSRRPEYELGHLPGAYFVELRDDLAGPRLPGSGNNPLPEIDALQASVARWGVDDDSLVVVYGADDPVSPARAWFVLTWAGLKRVKYLDGGLAAWVADGGELTTVEPVERQGSARLKAGSLPTLDEEGVRRIAYEGVLLDARRPEDYSAIGQPNGGHIPGALSSPASITLDSEGNLIDEQSLRARFAELGVDGSREVGVYCGGGVAATQIALVLRTLGIPSAVYIGSWSAWSADPSRERAIGSDPWGEVGR